ncbi:ABC transporter substrate-binding protein [Bifidobacterium avesanii]|uniref:Extracellular solute-binding protein n=1 Tax=Bifidobacterium avesanii TaxID=1798157 RepID=A0A7K3TJK4_9BIFI|nr:extracellular solute-binding protein [Bifidobacterium avesanii]KAB8289571.1 ABC transporter, solute-binding protein [Bifidobacterium avesanii]NEG79126.1 extracellular solute-binding protein [Bifidobacterium avesanii]
MPNNIRITATAAITAALLALAGCGSGQGGASSAETFDPNAKTEITLGGWSLSTANNEFKTLADGFMKKYPNVTVTLKEYSADDFDKQMTTDLSGGNMPDAFPIKNLQKYYLYAKESGALADLNSVAATYRDDKNIDISQYNIDGTYYALPYRQDLSVLFYNKTMFDKAGVAVPDGTWTWDDYMRTARELKQKLPAAGYDPASVYPTYHHSTWQAYGQAIATAQAGDADKFQAGDFDYMKDYYNNVFLPAQDEGLTISYNTANATKVQYAAQFDTEKAAMMLMDTWQVGGVITDAQTGNGDKFEWGIAPLPQNASNTSGTPVTYGDPTGFAVFENSSGQKRAAAMEFVKWAAGEEASALLAQTHSTPSYFSQKVIDTYFAAEGVPQDELSRTTWSKHTVKPENPVTAKTNEIQGNLKIAHSTIMTETGSVDAALAKASADTKQLG